MKDNYFIVQQDAKCLVFERIYGRPGLLKFTASLGSIERAEQYVQFLDAQDDAKSKPADPDVEKPPKPPRKGGGQPGRWKPGSPDRERFHKMWKERRPVREIAEALGLTYESARIQARRLGFGPKGKAPPKRHKKVRDPESDRDTMADYIAANGVTHLPPGQAAGLSRIEQDFSTVAPPPSVHCIPAGIKKVIAWAAKTGITIAAAPRRNGKLQWQIDGRAATNAADVYNIVNAERARLNLAPFVSGYFRHRARQNREGRQ